MRVERKHNHNKFSVSSTFNKQRSLFNQGIPLTVHVAPSFRYLLLSTVSSADPLLHLTTSSSDPLLHLILFFIWSSSSSDHAVIPAWIDLPPARQDTGRPSFSTMISKVTRATWTIVTWSGRGWSLAPFASSSLLLVFCWVHFLPVLWTGTMLTKNSVSVDLNLRKTWTLMVFSRLKDTWTTSAWTGLWKWRPQVSSSSDLKNQGTLPTVPRLLLVVHRFQWNNQTWTQFQAGNLLKWPETTCWDGFWRCAAS